MWGSPRWIAKEGTGGSHLHQRRLSTQRWGFRDNALPPNLRTQGHSAFTADSRTATVGRASMQLLRTPAKVLLVTRRGDLRRHQC